MASTIAPTFDLVETYVHLPGNGDATVVAGGDRFWQEIDRRTELHDGLLVTAFDCAADWSHWEMHPAGDEVVCLLAGALALVLDEAAGERVVELRAGCSFIVPRGVWHRANVQAPSRALHITAGKGTLHRALADAS